MQIIVLGLVAAVSALPTYPVQSTYGYGQGGSYVVRSQSDCVAGDECARPKPLPSRPVGGGYFRSETRQEIRNRRSADHRAKAN